MSDFEVLQDQAQSLGLVYTGDDVDELRMLVTMARKRAGAEHPVPCYGVSYDPTDKRCRICQLNTRCADVDQKPRVELLETKLQPVACAACEKGSLEEELVDPDTAEVRDYGCTNPGCHNRLSIQAGWETHGGSVARKTVIGDEVIGEEAPEPPQEAPESPEVAEPPKASKKPVLRVVRGEKGSKKASKAAKKAVTKKASKTTKKVVTKRNGAKPKLAFVYEGETYGSLSACVCAITGNKSWSPRKFFKGLDPASVAAGDVLTREWRDETVSVEVIDG